MSISLNGFSARHVALAYLTLVEKQINFNYSLGSVDIILLSFYG